MTYTHICSLNHNDDTSPFIEKTKIISYKITILSLTCVPKFHGLWSFQTGPLHRYASPRCYSALSLRSLLRLDVLECSSGVIPSCYSGARLRPCPQPEALFTIVILTRSEICTGTLKIIYSGGSALEPRGEGSLPPSNPKTTRSCRSICVMTLFRATNHQGNNQAPQLNIRLVVFVFYIPCACRS